ncbi:glycosyl hydrolase family 18 protein [Romboutsia lituseburensis]|uniref:chitinase n=1 Tax=Romboutsia lituseburensis DSM 797 TaxID=1121325 RepID=A0A1G9S1R9_9FIRM|nr:glycosyl hydrolase family 18 protein [Romboutsia lituseburensis]CEH32875.1 Chitinase A1 [Romboutsia lituseburensis]SDM28685.1 Chitinase, GH18 family [Romboutsia lituseburensis DSM 797]
MHIKRLKRTKKSVAIAIIGSMLISTGTPLAGVLTVSANENEIKVVKSNTQKRNVMYYGDWSIWGGQGNFYPKDIPAEELTHLNFAFMDFDAQGNLIFTDKDAAVGAPVGQAGVQWGAPNAGILNALQELRAKNPNLKLGISVGGWSKSGDFSPMAANPQARANFIKNIIKFVEYTNMDFVDLDWEFPGEVRQGDLVDNKNDEGTPHSTPQDKENYTILLEELREALDAKGVENGKDYELTVALPAPKKKQEKIDIDRLFEIVDFANIMTYDLRGAWDDKSGHQTALYPNPNDPINNESEDNLSIDESVDYLIEQGAEPEKIVIGAAFYTRGWDKVAKGDDAKLPGLHQPAQKTGKDADQTPSYGAPNEAPLTNGDSGRAAGCWTYRGLDKLKAQYPGLKEYWDDTAKAPYLYDESTGKFFTYDNVKSVEEKAKYVNENNLGGMIGWMSSQDKPTNGSTKRDELTKTMKKGLFGDSELSDHEIVYSDLDIAATVNTYEQEWGADRKGYEITIKNNERAEESDAVLKEVEKGAETIKAPKLYIKTDKPLNRGDHMSGTVTYENGYTVVDLKSVWEGKNIEQGQTYTFKLSGDAKIESIDIVQRMSDNSPEIARQTIFGEKGPEVNQVPVLKGISNKTIKVGDSFNELAGVTATDKEDGDLTSKIKVSGNVDTTKVGKYELTYKVSDSKGLETVANRTITVEEAVVTPPQEDSDFGVGQGIQWPSQVNAPFADMTAWNNGDFSNNGALNLKKISQDTGVKFFNLGFIQSTGGVSNGKVNWGWGGHEVLSERHADNTQYQGIKKSIKDIREIGGDVTISLGGLNGVAPWEVTQDVNTLYNTYKEIVQGYGLTRIDLDIEGGATNKQHNIANAKAIKKVQDETGVDIVLTLAVMPSGLTSVQLDVLEAYLSQGVDVEVVNIMTMCYGASVPDYAVGSVQAVDNTMKQVKEYFKKYANRELTDEQAYRKVGMTPSVGFEGSAHPIFDTEDTKIIVDHAIEKEIGMVSMWSINRDSKAQDNQGINNAYEHTNLMKQFGKETTTPDPEENKAPVFSGIANKTIKVGEIFDALSGVTATDKEDGNLTDKIKVSGKADTSKAGKYELTYSVTDSKGLTTTAKRTITVESVSVEGDTYDSTKIYYGGELVTYKGQEYKAKWWTQGEAPDKSQAWEKIVKPNEDGSINYEPGMIFTGGETVKYEGKSYKAKWWTNTVPGSDDSWQLIG